MTTIRNNECRLLPLRVSFHPAFLCLALALAVFAVFWPVVGHDFINLDDPGYFYENPHVQKGLNWQNILWAFATTDLASWYPLTWLSFMLDATLFGNRPFGPHLTNLLLHTGNTLLLFLLLWRLTGAPWPSAFVAALFAIHPLQVESVAWVSERKGLLSTMFNMLALGAYARYATNDKNKPAKTAPWYWVALGMYVCGLMSKPMLVTLPGVLLLLDFWPLRRLQQTTPRRLCLEKIPFLVIGLISTIVTVLVHKKAGSLVPIEAAPMAIRLQSAVVAYAQYLAKTFWPFQLATPYPPAAQPPLGQVLLAAVLVVGLSLAVIALARRRPALFVGWFWFLVTLLPVVGLIQWGVQTMADRYTYVPLIGIFIMAAWAVGDMPEPRRVWKPVSLAVAALALGSLALRANHQLHYWKDSETLFRHALAVTANNAVALNNLGVCLTDRGRLEEATECFREALRISPNDADAWFNWGNALARAGRFAEAATRFENALHLRPDHYWARNNLGKALERLGRVDEAIKQYRLILQDQPGNALVHKNLADALRSKGNLEEAVAHYRRALAENPADADTQYALGITLAIQGDWDGAIRHYQETLRLSPTNAEAHYNLGYAFRVKNQLDAATAHLRDAVRLKPEFPLAHYNLGCVLADRGSRDEAVSHLQEALRLKPDYKEAVQKLQELGVPADK